MQILRALDINQVLLNSKKYTAFKLYQESGGLLVFQSNQYIKGHYKKESTVLRKYNAQLSLSD